MRLALDAAAIGVWEYDIGTDKLTWDDRVREVAEVDADIEPTWAGDFLPAVHPDDRAAVTDAFGALVAGGHGAKLSIDCRVIGRRTGRVTWAALEGRCLTCKTGGLRVIGTARDITVERSATEQLRHINERLEQRVAEVIAERQIWADMFEGSDDPVAAVDPDLRVIAMNRAYRDSFQRLFRTSLKIGDDLSLALSAEPEARDVAVSIWRRALAGEVVDVPRSREGGPNGASYDIKFRPLYDRHGKLVGAFQYSRDVTTRVRANERLREVQEALQRSQKMEALGQLTGGVAHDFNNMLQVIGGNLQLLKKDIQGNARAERRVENALAGVARGSKLASQLLAFGRRQPLEPKVVNLGRFIRNMDDMLRRALGEEVEVQVIVSGGLWNTLVDPGQIENALLNLAINARDAMGGPGHLTIEAGNALLDDDYARQHAEVTAGQYVMVAVTDTGSGMSPDVLERVFEPFFSTKPEGKGTGLGLSMVYGLVKQSGGHIKIYSEIGEGTTIKLYLPRAMEKEDVLPVPENAQIQGGSETVLVVEDDEAVRETAVALLTDLGYRVLKAPEATSALAVIDSGVAIDLLFTDVVMPGPVRSPELARKAKERIPNLAVLFTSGYTENAIVHGGRLDAGVELLSKPYTREALARKIRHVLANRQQHALATRTLKTDSPPPAPEPLAGEPHAGVCVLLVEDDAAIRADTAEMLRVLGHEVKDAGDADAAIAVLQAEPIDILVVDRGLPGMSGDDLAQKALAMRPDLDVIFATGEAIAVPDASIPRTIHLIKPYALPDLQRAIAQALGRRTQAPATA